VGVGWQLRVRQVEGRPDGALVVAGDLERGELVAGAQPCRVRGDAAAIRQRLEQMAAMRCCGATM
jgi:hypothetical protein